jgi:HK97 family phage major capsid protein
MTVSKLPRAGMKRLAVVAPQANAADPAPTPQPSAPGSAEIKGAVEKLQNAFAAFTQANDERLAALEKGKEDVVANERVDRISADITSMQAQVEGLGDLLQGAVHAGSGDRVAPEVAANVAAWDRFVRRGDEAAYAATIKPAAIKAAGSTQSDPDGGFLVPDAQESAITRILGTTSIMRGLASVVNTSRPAYEINKDIGGASSGWVEEQESRPETDTPQLSKITIPTHEIYANPRATQGLLDDAATNVEEWFANAVRIEFDEQEGAAFISGSGIGKPKGLISDGYTKVANASWAWGKLGFSVSGVAAALSDGSNNGVDALTDLVYSLKAGYRQGASFLMNDLTTAAVRKLKDGDGQYLWQPAIQPGEPATLLGYAVRSDDNMPDIAANAFPIAFADFRRGYTIVDRIGIRVLRDPYTSKPYVSFYTTKRVGGGVSDFQAIKLLKISA